jgi:hypothetical protein
MINVKKACFLGRLFDALLSRAFRFPSVPKIAFHAVKMLEFLSHKIE